MQQIIDGIPYGWMTAIHTLTGIWLQTVICWFIFDLF